MAKSTADCKAFLVDFFTKNPSVILSIFGAGMSQTGRWDLLANARNPKKWKRTHKCAAGKGHYTLDTYSLFDVDQTVVRMGYGAQRKVPASSFTVERAFLLDVDTYDTGVAFLVVEDAQGTLSLADYVGD